MKDALKEQAQYRTEHHAPDGYLAYQPIVNDRTADAFK